MTRYAVLGYGKSGESVVRFLAREENADFFICVPEREYGQLAKRHPDLPFVRGMETEGADVIVRSPGIRPDAECLRRAVARGACITSEVALFLEHCPAPVFAVTGSDGKTTTATLAAMMLEAEGHTVHLGGNIGVPLLDRVEDILPSHRVVLELSSFQLMDMTPILAGAAVTNLTENHLDWHRDMEEYRAAKQNILPFARRRVQNACSPIAPVYPSLTFSARCRSANYHLSHGVLMHGEEPLVSASALRVRGTHNIENILCAAALTGASATTVNTVATAFSGVAHRMEYCGQVGGVACYNASIDTTPARTAVTLKALPRGMTVVCGGAGKNLSWEPLCEALAAYAGCVVFTGAVGQEMQAAFAKHLSNFAGNGTACEVSAPKHIYTEDFAKALDMALVLTPRGGTLVLSPAATSFDSFTSYTERGDFFRTWVKTKIHAVTTAE